MDIRESEAKTTWAIYLLAAAILIAAVLMRAPRYQFSDSGSMRFDTRSGEVWVVCSSYAREAGVCKGWIRLPASTKKMEALREANRIGSRRR